VGKTKGVLFRAHNQGKQSSPTVHGTSLCFVDVPSEVHKVPAICKFAGLLTCLHLP